MLFIIIYGRHKVNRFCCASASCLARSISPLPSHHIDYVGGGGGGGSGGGEGGGSSDSVIVTVGEVEATPSLSVALAVRL